MHTEWLDYSHGHLPLKGYFVSKHPQSTLPVVLVASTWYGLNSFTFTKTKAVAALGYHAFAIDMYGNGKQVTTPEEAKQQISPLVADRTILRERILAAVDFVKKHPKVDAKNIAAIGYCFGGTCVIELAKSGAKLNGVVSLHGVLGNPHHLFQKAVPTADYMPTPLLVLHGYRDPLVSQKDIQHFQQEMDERKADWQLHFYGEASHAFTNPEANHPEHGLLYHQKTDFRAWKAVESFLQEAFFGQSEKTN